MEKNSKNLTCMSENEYLLQYLWIRTVNEGVMSSDSQILIQSVKYSEHLVPSLNKTYRLLDKNGYS